MNRAPKVVIAAGGTAGHVVPALAVAGALRAEGAEVQFIGGERAETELVPAAGFELRRIAVEGMSRSNPLHAARALWRAARAYGRALSLLRELRPDAVLGGGGYVAGPTGLAAVTLRIPLVLSEADSHLGLTNRVLARGARRVCLAFPLAAEGDYVLVFGGSLGARSINMAAVEAFAGKTLIGEALTGEALTGEAPAGGTPTGAPATDLTTGETASTPVAASGRTPFHGLAAGETVAEITSTGAAFSVLHVAGRRDYPELAARPLPGGYDLREYLDLDEFGDALAVAALVVARAGGSVFEIAASGTPAILVPYPHASADHQTENARWMERAGAAVVIADGELNAARLAKEAGELLADRKRLAAMARASRGLARPDAAMDIAGELLQAAGA